MEINYIKAPKILRREYASYRPWVIEFFISNVLRKTDFLLDPMAGTSPFLPYCEYMNINACFNDILPFHKYVNVAKTFKVYRGASQFGFDSIKKELLRLLKPIKYVTLVNYGGWIPVNILNALIKAWKLADSYPYDIKSFIKAILILLSRALSSYRSTDNSIWFKPGGITTEMHLAEVIDENVARYQAYYDVYYKDRNIPKAGRINYSSTNMMGLSFSRHFDTIFASPPYENRTDYCQMYAPELFFLSKLSPVYNPELIDKMFLSSNNKVVNYKSLDDDLNYIKTQSIKTYDFLSKIKAKSKEKSYYYPKCFTLFYVNYFRMIPKLLSLLTKRGRLYLVVQNNIHRGELNEMDAFTIDFCATQGYEATIADESRHHHQGKRNISAEHPLVISKHKETILLIKK